MALLRRLHLAKKYGVVAATVKNAIDSGRLVICMENGTVLIDTDDEKNKAQLDAWKLKMKLEKSGEPDKSERKVRTVQQEPTEAQKLDLEKKRLSVEKQREDLEKTRLEKRKLTGEMVPTDSVRSIFSLLGASFQKTYQSNIEGLLQELFHRAKVDPAISAEFLSRSTDAINEAHVLAIQAAQKSLKQVVKDQTK